MRERLEKFIKTEGLTPTRFAEILGVQPSSISHLLGGRNKPSYDFLEKMLLRFPKVNPDWLLLGKGNMYRSDIIKQEDVRKDPSLHTIALTSQASAVPNDLFQQDETARSQSKIDQKQPDSFSPDTFKIPKAPSKVERIIVLYDDHSFRAYDHSGE